MNLIIILDNRWFKDDFDICIRSFKEETSIDCNIVFVVKEGTDKSIVIEKEFKIVKTLEEAKDIIENDITIVMKTPILFYKDWDIRMNKVIKKLGSKYNYVPSFVNNFGEQLSILDKVYPNNILFDLDYKRDPMKKNNIDYFDKICEIQYKEIDSPLDWITFYTDKNLENKKVVCVLSCAVAILKR